jgi:hypothetical protein
MERWRDIPGHPGYEVSDEGRVRSWRCSGMSERRRDEPRILRQGRAVLIRSAMGFKISRSVPRLVLLAFVGPPDPPCALAGFIDGDRTNLRVENLRWMTASEIAGRREGHRGERHPSSKLKRADVEAILAAEDVAEAEMARRYGVTASRIWQIRNGQAWRHVGGDAA